MTGEPGASGGEYPDDVAGLARELVRIPSENPPGEERAVAEYVVDWCEHHGLDAELVPTPEAPERPNAVAVVGDHDGADDAGGPTLVLNGHTDVVPAGDRGAWTHDPYAGEIVSAEGGGDVRGGGDVLYGRGSADMKTGVAVALATALELAPRFESGDLDGALVVHAAAGEETGLPGTRTLVDEGYGGDCAIVLEPTELRVATSAKGVVTYRVTVRGESAHASHPDEGRNALDGARALFDRFDAYDAEVRERVDDLVGRGYATVTSVEGGTDGNMAVVPDGVEFLLDRRVLPAESIEAVDAEVEAVLDAAAREDGVDADVETVQYYRSASIPSDHAFAELVRDCTGDRAPRDPWGLEAATDAREFVADGIPAVVWGPGSLSQAHTVDEHVDLDEARDARGVLESVAERVLDGDLDDALDGDLAD
ncbi:M20 family metallopeptidase [Halorubellus sp. JP-L1]|uniref:M20 family metallopeptidase n=1 Tax=Halorubellus sp. JP-L1 TaxID=2715753 RepID=UPI00140BB92A|nr:M20/M25/M40 family metallo-hydrolase [Halorubellus sp. JP-L1]NHN40895.1 M20 family metallopeptidase [Halorubellus sp. JP-L1]